jgi:hypothetical protein
MDMTGDTLVLHDTLAGALAHSAGYKLDGVTPWLPAIVPSVKYPGNAGDLDTTVSVNGVVNNDPTKVIPVTDGDIVNLYIHSPGGATDFQAFTSMYQVVPTGTIMNLQHIFMDSAPGGFWLYSDGSFDLIPFIDGLGFFSAGPSAFPALLPSQGMNFAFPIPAGASGLGLTLFIQTVIRQTGLNILDLGIDDAIEFPIP